MSDCDISAAENVDTTDEGYLNHLLSEKDKAIKELASALDNAGLELLDIADRHGEACPFGFECQEIADKYLGKD